MLKPSKRNPSVAVHIAKLFSETGLLDGMLNLVNNDKEAVDVILGHSDIDAVSIVGSTAIREYVYARGTESTRPAKVIIRQAVPRSETVLLLTASFAAPDNRTVYGRTWKTTRMQAFSSNDSTQCNPRKPVDRAKPRWTNPTDRSSCVIRTSWVFHTHPLQDQHRSEAPVRAHITHPACVCGRRGRKVWRSRRHTYSCGIRPTY